VPEELLRPLTGEQHGGQITLLPGGSQIQLDESLVKKGVIFADLHTAERDHADLLKKLAGPVVQADDGKLRLHWLLHWRAMEFCFMSQESNGRGSAHSVLWVRAPASAHFSHIIVFVDDGASVTYVPRSGFADEAGNAMHAGIG